MSQQSLFTTVPLNLAEAAPIYVQTGFTPGRIELINLTQLQASPHVATNGYEALWQYGMPQGSAITQLFGASSTFLATPGYIASGGITLLNPLGMEKGQYGATISGFTNASPGVIAVDSTFPTQIMAGNIIRVAGVADNQSGTSNPSTLNGDYYVASVTATTITLGTAPVGLWTQTVLSSPNTSTPGISVYVSGGWVTVLQTSTPTVPNPPYDVYSDVPSWWNSAIQGFTIGASTFANATYSTTTPDIILVAAWDMMQP